MNELMERYHQTLKRRMSPATYDTERYIVPEFLLFLKGKDVNLSDVNRQILEAWLEFLSSVKNNSPRTLEKKISRIRGFFKWLVDEDKLLVSPVPEKFHNIRPKPRLRKVPDKFSTFVILEQAGNSQRFPLRNRAILELCYSTGLRRSELWSLNVSDVLDDEIRVTGKGNKERIVPPGQKAVKYLNAYIRVERRDIVRRHDPLEKALFLSRDGKRLNKRTYNAILKEQVKSPYGLHSFRHACATHMLKNGANIVVLQKLLGHEKLNTTQQYTRVEVGTLQEMLEECHPRG